MQSHVAPLRRSLKQKSLGNYLFSLETHYRHNNIRVLKGMAKSLLDRFNRLTKKNLERARKKRIVDAELREAFSVESTALDALHSRSRQKRPLEASARPCPPIVKYYDLLAQYNVLQASQVHLNCWTTIHFHRRVARVDLCSHVDG